MYTDWSHSTTTRKKKRFVKNEKKKYITVKSTHSVYAQNLKRTFRHYARQRAVCRFDPVFTGTIIIALAILTSLWFSFSPFIFPSSLCFRRCICFLLTRKVDAATQSLRLYAWSRYWVYLRSQKEYCRKKKKKLIGNRKGQLGLTPELFPKIQYSYGSNGNFRESRSDATQWTPCIRPLFDAVYKRSNGGSVPR